MMQQIILDFMNQYGYFAILFLIAMETIFPPIPSEIILTFGGFMTIHTDMNLILVIIFATIGSLIGATILYYVGCIFNKERLIQFSEGKIGKKLRFKKQEIEKADQWFIKKGYYTVFFCRFIPVVRSLISIPAGMSKMSFSVFFALTLIGSLLWNTVLIVLGYVMGDQWEIIASWVNLYSKALFLLLIILILLVTLYYFNKRKKK